MAKKLKAGAKEAPANGGAVKQPDFVAAIRVLRGDVNPSVEESAKIRGDLSAAWKAIEKDHNCNKKGAKFVHSLMRMDVQVRDDVLRTVYGMMKAAEIGISEDLVSLMSDDDVTTMPITPIKDSIVKARAHLGGAGATESALN